MKKFLSERLRNEALACSRLAAPIIATQLAFVSMGTVDTILAGRLGALPLAAVAVGANVWFLFFIFFLGLFMAVSPIVAHRLGAGRPAAETGGFTRNALELAVVLGLAWTVSLQLLTTPVLNLLELDVETHALATGYLRAIAFGGVPFCLSFVLRNVADGHGLTRVSLAAAVVGLITNAVFGYVLMYGKLGLPAMGPTGTGWATVIAGWAMVACYVILYARTPALRELRLFRRARPAMRIGSAEILRLGLPITAIVTAEMWLFIIGALLMARFGGDVVAAHQIAINFASMAFMVPLSIGMATTVRVGYAAGAGASDEIALRGRMGIALGAGFALISAAAMVLLPRAIVALYTDDPEITALAVRFLLYAAVFQLADCVQATSNGALRGIKDTRLPMAITIGAYWLVGMPLAVWLAFATRVGPAGIWWGFIAGLAVAAVGLCARFLKKTALRNPSMLMT